jgi:hypothetical protein
MLEVDQSGGIVAGESEIRNRECAGCDSLSADALVSETKACRLPDVKHVAPVEHDRVCQRLARLQEFADVVDPMENYEFHPQSVKELTVREGERGKFVTRVCRNFVRNAPAFIGLKGRHITAQQSEAMPWVKSANHPSPEGAA